MRVLRGQYRLGQRLDHRLGERGSARHALLLLMVGAILVGVLHWQGRVGCIFESVAQGLATSTGLSGINC